MLQRRLHDTGSKHKLSLAEFRELNTFLTSTQAEFRQADESRTGKLGLEELDGSLKRAGPPLRCQDLLSFPLVLQSPFSACDAVCVQFARLHEYESCKEQACRPLHAQPCSDCNLACHQPHAADASPGV